MSQSETEFDIEQAKQEARDKYESETGHELPEHVLENIRLLRPGPTINDMEVAHEYGKESAERDFTNGEVAATVLLVAVVVGAIAYGAGVALAGSFGLAVVAIVSTLFGVTVGVLLS